MRRCEVHIVPGESSPAVGLHRLLHRAHSPFPGPLRISGIGHDRHRILHFNVTTHPSTEWTGQQVREAFAFDQLPRYLLRDRDNIFAMTSKTRCATWHPRSSVCTALALAASLRRAADWFDSARVPGSSDRVQRSLATAYSSFVFRLLPQIPDPSL